MLLTLRGWHPPATVAAFVAGLDLFGALRDLLATPAGAVFVTAICWATNRAFGVPLPTWTSDRLTPPGRG